MSTFNIFERNVQDPCSAACDIEDLSFNLDSAYSNTRDCTQFKFHTYNKDENKADFTSYSNSISIPSSGNNTNKRYTSSSPFIPYSNVFSDNEYDSDNASDTPDFDDGIIKPKNNIIKNRTLKNGMLSHTDYGSLSKRNHSVNTYSYNKQDINRNCCILERPILKTRANSCALIHQIARSPIYASNNNINNNNMNIKTISRPKTPVVLTPKNNNNNNNNEYSDSHDSIPRFFKNRSMSFSSTCRNNSFIFNPLLRSSSNVNIGATNNTDCNINNNNNNYNSNTNTRNHFRRQSSSYAIPTHVYGLEKYVSSALDELSSKSNNNSKDSGDSSTDATQSFKSSEATMVDTATTTNGIDKELDSLRDEIRSPNAFSTTPSISSTESLVSLEGKSTDTANTTSENTNRRKVNNKNNSNNKNDAGDYSETSLSKHSNTRKSFIKLSLANSFA